MTSKIAGDVLAKNPVFAVLPAPKRRELAEAGRSVELAKGRRLFNRGDSPDAAYAIISGEIEVTIEGPDGRAVFIARLGMGDVVGEMGVLDGVSRSTDATAMRKTELWRIERAHVLDALTHDPGSALALLSVLARRIRDTDALVDRTASMEMGKRLARLLLEESVHGRIIYNQSDLAHLIGATREAVNRKLSRWRKDKWIEINHTGLHVLDRNALLALCKRRAAI
jgi:CRP/FNR family transcriptional regulator, cyclic AMP receptor protein